VEKFVFESIGAARTGSYTGTVEVAAKHVLLHEIDG